MTSNVDPLAPEQTQNPYALYEKLRSNEPVTYVEEHGFWMVTSYELCMQVLRKPAIFRQWDGDEMYEPGQGPPLGHPDKWAPDVREAMEGAYPPVSTLVTANPPRHTQYRQLANAAFSARKTAEGMEARLREIVDELIDEFPRDGEVEFVESFAVPFPIRAIAEILGVPPSMYETFKRWSDSTVVAIAGGVSTETMVDSAKDIVEFQRFFVEQLEDRRASPRDDVITVLAQAKLGGDRPLTNPEALGIILHLLVAGNETTTNLLGSLVHGIVDRGLTRELRADPSLIPSVVEETLRLESPVQALFRRTATDVELGGVTIPAGAKLLVSFGAANRDGQVFERAETFQPQRNNVNRHLAFGFGAHYCLGAPLARKEAVIAVEALLARLPGLSLKRNQDLVYLDHAFLRGLEHLSLTYDEIGARQASTADTVVTVEGPETSEAVAEQLTVEVDTTTCVGTGDCRRLLPSVFGANADGKARVRDSRGGTDDEITVAAEGCPVGAIRVARQGRRLV